MAKGTIELARSSLNASASYIVGKIDWESTPDNPGNESDVTGKLYVKKDNDSLTLTEATYGTWTYELTINGERISGTTIASVLSDWVLIATKTVANIDHNGDGTKSISISGSVTAPTGTSYAYKKSSGSGTAKLDNIPRASTITDLAGDIGKRCTVRWTPASGKFRFEVKLSIGDWSYTSGVIFPGSTSRYTYSAEIPLEVAEQIPNSKIGDMSVSLYTYSDAAGLVQVGNVSTKTLKLTVPENSNTLPTVTAVTSPVHTLPDAFSGLYIQGKSKVKVTAKAAAKLGASIESCTVKVDGTKHTGTTITSDYLSNYGSISVVVTVVDSRGYSATKSIKLTVIPYVKPSILPATGEKFVVATRCDEDGNVTDSGTYLQIRAKRSYSKVISGDVQKNFCKIRFRYKQEKADAYSSWVTILAEDSLDSDEIVTGPLLDGALMVKNTYLVQVQAIDDIGGSTSTTITVPTDKVYSHKDGARRSFTFGGYVEEDNTFAIAEDITFRAKGPIEAQGGGNIDILILGTKITATAEEPVSLNDYKTPGNYYSPNADNSQYISDSPYTKGGFALTVRELQTTGYIRQELFYGRTSWIRHWDGTEWSDWWRYQTTTVAETASVDYVIETGVSDGWTYRKWKGGTYELFGTFEITPTESTLNETLYRTNNMTIAVPFPISSAYVSGTVVGYYWITNGGISGNSKITLRLMSDKAFSTTTAIEVRLKVVGTYA